MSATVLVTENYGGNLHQTASALNQLGLSEYVLAMDSISGSATVVVLKMGRQTAVELSNAGKIGAHYAEKFK